MRRNPPCPTPFSQESMSVPADTFRRSALLTAAAVTLAALAGLTLTVQATHQGDWTGLFCIGSKFAGGMQNLPPGRAFPDSNGYDGQFYRAVAHNPWLRTEAWRAIDDPEMRYRRILIPLAAWLLAAGQPALIDGAYVAAILICLFLGAYFLALWLAREGLPPAAGAVFLFLPGTLISLDRMMPDIALYTILAALLAVWRGRLTPAVAVLLALAPLVRTIGLLACAAVAIALISARRWRDAGMIPFLGLPVVAWWVWLNSQLVGQVSGVSTPSTPGQLLGLPHWLLKQPGYGLLLRIFDPVPYPGLPPAIETATQVLDILAWLGMLFSVVIVTLSWRRFTGNLPGLLILLWIPLFLLASGRGFWRDPYSYPRAFTPLLGLLLWEAARRRQWWFALPLLLVTLRVGAQLFPQASLGLRWLLGS